MNNTNQTLLDQMHITEPEVMHRKNLFSFSEEDAKLLLFCKNIILENIDFLVSDFYETQINIPEIALLIGDADTLARLRSAQRRYILDLFSGVYDLEYVHNRLRIGLVHKRIGVEPKLYLSAIYTLQSLLHQMLIDLLKASDAEVKSILRALDKLLMFDITLVFDMYIRSMVSEVESARNKSEQYAQIMEEKVKERTRQLEDISHTDALTGLLNVRNIEEIVTTALRSAQRRMEPVTAIYIDADDFKKINDQMGHQRGDEILRAIGKAIKSLARIGDICIRYGGDEFFVLLGNCTEVEARTIFVERLEKTIKIALNDVSLSIGVAQTGPNEYMEGSALIQLADKRMYEVKQTHKSPDKTISA